jgi:hypothetical protein
MRLLACLSIVAVTTPALCAQYFIVQEGEPTDALLSNKHPAPAA